MEFAAAMWYCRKVLEAPSNYKRSSLWWLRNLAFTNSNGTDGVEKDWICVFPGFYLRKWRRRGGGVVVCLSVINSRMVSMLLFLFRTDNISGMERRFKKRLCCIASGKWTATRITLLEFVTRYMMFYYSHSQQLSLLQLRRKEFVYHKGRIFIYFLLLILWTLW